MRSFRSWTTTGPAGLVVVLLFLPARPAAAHPMPHSIVALDVRTSMVTADIQIPVRDLTYAAGVDLTTDDAPAVLGAHQEELREYLIEHVRPITDGVAWKTALSTVTLSESEQRGSGTYREILATAAFWPPAGASTRRFDLHADPVIHQVVTHTVLVTAVEGGQGRAREIGTIRTDTATMTVPPLHVDLGNTSWWPTFNGWWPMAVAAVAALVAMIPAVRARRRQIVLPDPTPSTVPNPVPNPVPTQTLARSPEQVPGRSGTPA
ncbi:hypothetical protein KIH74_07455 [Kineosporia sp. J2-2]|uniref:Uncharacterized protein n=1 Tax=Kineosporia corallincola TaxID=2835133 RepID=A0ABS5TCJ4_9ACTN|nr:hypothetical protein [Kineosporia corallincola]MBT0768756.1 hypothetical protein [Kineosporia corallincola]